MSFYNDLLCLNEQDYSLEILDTAKQCLNTCFLNVYTLAPSYILFSAYQAYLVGSLRDIPRNQANKRLTFLRFSSLLVLVGLWVDMFVKYLLTSPINNQTILSQHLVIDLYRIVAIAFNTFVLFNKDLFHKISPHVFCLVYFGIVFVNQLYLFNWTYANWPLNYAIMTFMEKYNTIVLFSYNLIILLNLVTLVWYYADKVRMDNINFARLEEERMNRGEFESLRDQCQNMHVSTYDLELEEEGEEDSASFYSYLTFNWLGGLMNKGYMRQITKIQDLCFLSRDLNLQQVFDSFLMKYVKPNENNSYVINPILNPDLLRDQAFVEKNGVDYEEDRFVSLGVQPDKTLFSVILSSFGLEFFLLGVLKFLDDCLSFSGPLLLNQLVSFVQNKDTNLRHGILCASGLLFTTLTACLLNIHFSYLLNKLCLRARIALVSLIYRKTLLVKLNELNKYSIGQIVNYMSIDTDSIVNGFPSFHSLWSLPLKIAIALYLLYSQIGISFLVGVGFVLVLIPINKFISDFIGRVQTKMMDYKDHRVKIITEFLEGIRVVKFCAWENYFTKRIRIAREKELGQLKAKKYLDAGCVYFWASTPILMSVLTFITYVQLGNELTPTKVFTSLALFNMLINPLNAFPWVINGLVQANVSLKRVQQFLKLENLNWLGYYTLDENFNPRSTDTLVDINHAEFSWRQSQNQVGMALNDHNIGQHSVLEDISLKIKRGDLIGIVGKVGSGKSSLLHALLAEIEKNDGNVRISPDVCSNGFAYVGQENWIQASSIRENILFGADINSDCYKRVIESCALVADLETLPRGDDTPVGENGICLSGGQKARVALARACYSMFSDNKQMFVLDDPLSAVDSHVAKHIFNECITGLLSQTTRILVTHHYKYLMNADLVIVVEDGRIIRSGRGLDVIPRFVQYFASISSSVDEQQKQQSDAELASMDDMIIENQRNGESAILDDLRKLDEQELKRQDEEEKEQGQISAGVYKYYCWAVGVCLSIMTVVFLILMQGTKNLTDFWLSYWTQVGDESRGLNGSFSPHVYVLNPAYTHFYTASSIVFDHKRDSTFFFEVYAALCFANTIFTLFRAFCFAYSGIRAGRYIHEVLITNLSKASLKFFDHTPRGRILNRLSSDMYAIDDSLPFIFNIFLATLFGLVGIIIVTCYSLPWFSVCLVPLSIIYYSLQDYYRWTSRELKRLSSISLSPVYTHFHETIKGLVTIRAFRRTNQFSHESQSLVKNYIRASFTNMAANQWLHFRLQMISVVMITTVGITAVVQNIYGTANASLIGLALSYILSVTGLLNGLIGSFAETEKEMVSVERAHQFERLESENWHGMNYESWPMWPTIDFTDVVLKYNSQLDASSSTASALNGVSLQIKAGEKIGICGRTGSGKSSLFMALFRGVELHSGSIFIDSINISTLGLQTLRENLSIIPQDPFLFEGSLRENLDITGEKSNEEMWSALREVRLEARFRSESASNDSDDGLNVKIEERGRNLSTGERQLVCLARAILSKRKILCIDEATASVDFETDNFIQETIRNKFTGVTVLTVAHRINTILDYDRVLVMESGRVAEFDSPKQLLSNKNSLFYSLVNESRTRSK